MYDRMDGHRPAPSWFWVSLALLLIASIVFYVLVNNDRKDQINIEKQTTFLQVPPGNGNIVF